MRRNISRLKRSRTSGFKGLRASGLEGFMAAGFHGFRVQGLDHRIPTPAALEILKTISKPRAIKS